MFMKQLGNFLGVTFAKQDLLRHIMIIMLRPARRDEFQMTNYTYLQDRICKEFSFLVTIFKDWQPIYLQIHMSAT